MLAHALALLLAALAPAAPAPPPPACRCRPPHPCFERVPFGELNASVGGRLIPVVDEFNACIQSPINSSGCQADLGSTDDEFFYSRQVGGFLHTGLAAGGAQKGWNIAHNLSAYAVAAEKYSDVVAAVAFAAKHNLRLAVKGTGHDWFGRSGSHPDLEGSLLVWTHKMKGMDWHDDEHGFVPEGCPASAAVEHSVTLQAGIQFADMYPVAEQRGRLINGGTCTSVGVGGCTLGGCFGAFSQQLGTSAGNVLQAKVVLANGTLVTASSCQNEDLFWALRGGGAGYGVVVEWTMRTYRSPDFLTGVKFSGHVASSNPDDIMAVAVEVLRAADGVLAARQGWNGDINVPVPGSANFAISLSTYEGNVSAATPLFDALDTWIKAQPASMNVSGSVSSHIKKRPSSGTWAIGGAPEGQVSLPWDDPHHDTEIGTEHLLSLSKWMTKTALHEGPGDTGLRKMATALMNISAVGCSGVLAGPLCRGHQGMGMHKSQGNAVPAVVEQFKETSINPVLLDTVGFLTSQWRVPAVPQLPPSSAVLKSMWPRLEKYTGIGSKDPLQQTCSDGAKGNEGSAKACFAQWAVRREQIVEQLQKVKATFNYHFPTSDGYSGSYWNEADYYEPNWQQSFWGPNYPKLLATKHRYDPDGLFTCHHCVGSEAMSNDGNCKL